MLFFALLEGMKLNIIEQYKGLRKETYILFFGTIVTNLGGMIWPMITLILNQKLGLDAKTISIYVMILGVLSVPLQMLGGKLADHYNKKMVIVYADIASIICFFICAALPLSLGSMILYSAASLLQNIEYPSYEALIADITPTKDRTKAFSLMYFGVNVGVMLSPMLGGLLFKNYLWLAFLLNGIAILLSTILIYFKVQDISLAKEEKGEENLYEETKEGDTTFSILKQNKVLVFYLFIYAISAAVYNQYNFLFPLELGRLYHEEGAMLYGTLASLNAFLVVLLTALITRQSYHWKDTVKISIGQILIVIGYLVFFAWMDDYKWVPYFAMTLFTIGEIYSTLSNGPYLTNRTPASHRGRIFAVNETICTLVYAAGNLILGKLYDGIGPNAAWIFVISSGTFVFLMDLLLIKLDQKAYPEMFENKQ